MGRLFSHPLRPEENFGNSKPSSENIAWKVYCSSVGWISNPLDEGFIDLAMKEKSGCER
jgi:hypothetical protein